MPLFTKTEVVDDLRQSRLALLPDGYLSNPSAISDDLLWAKYLAAEAFVSRYLGFPLQPTVFVSDEPTDEEKASFGDMPYVVEPGYDMPPDFFSVNNWGALLLRVRPVIEVQDVRFIFPSVSSSSFVVPKEWIRLDRKYGAIRFFPTAQAVSAPLSVFVLQAMGSGYTVPHMIRVRYVAGIDAKKPEYADVVDAVKKMSILKILTDCYLPQSGSISADGLSQSMSIDVSRFESSIYDTLDLLRQQVLGPVWGVL